MGSTVGEGIPSLVVLLKGVQRRDSEVVEGPFDDKEAGHRTSKGTKTRRNVDGRRIGVVAKK